MSKKDEIIKLAFDTFYEHGFHATGVDKVLLQSGISKRTLYKYFPTKEDLIRETIHYYREKSSQAMAKDLEKRGKNAAEKNPRNLRFETSKTKKKEAITDASPSTLGSSLKENAKK